MAFKMKGMTFGKGTSYKSPQLMAKEAKAKAAKKAEAAGSSPKHMSYGSPKEMYDSPKDMYGSPKDMYGSPKDMDHSPQKIYGLYKGVKAVSKGGKAIKDKASKLVTNVKKKFSKSKSTKVDDAAKKQANLPATTSKSSNLPAPKEPKGPNFTMPGRGGKKPTTITYVPKPNAPKGTAKKIGDFISKHKGKIIAGAGGAGILTGLLAGRPDSGKPDKTTPDGGKGKGKGKGGSKGRGKGSKDSKDTKPGKITTSTVTRGRDTVTKRKEEGVSESVRLDRRRRIGGKKQIDQTINLQTGKSKERKTKANKAKERFYDASGVMTRKTKDKRGKQKITKYEDGKVIKTKVNKRTGKVKVKTRGRGQIFAKKS